MEMEQKNTKNRKRKKRLFSIHQSVFFFFSFLLLLHRTKKKVYEDFCKAPSTRKFKSLIFLNIHTNCLFEWSACMNCSMWDVLPFFFFYTLKYALKSCVLKATKASTTNKKKNPKFTDQMVHMNIWTNGFLFNSINKDMKCIMGQMILRIHTYYKWLFPSNLNKFILFPFFFFLFLCSSFHCTVLNYSLICSGVRWNVLLLFYYYVRLMRIGCSNEFEVLAFFSFVFLIGHWTSNKLPNQTKTNFIKYWMNLTTGHWDTVTK